MIDGISLRFRFDRPFERPFRNQSSELAPRPQHSVQIIPSNGMQNLPNIKHRQIHKIWTKFMALEHDTLKILTGSFGLEFGQESKPWPTDQQFMHTCLQLHTWSDNTDTHSHAWTGIALGRHIQIISGVRQWVHDPKLYLVVQAFSHSGLSQWLCPYTA